MMAMLSADIVNAALHAFFGNGPKYAEWLAARKAEAMSPSAPDLEGGGEDAAGLQISPVSPEFQRFGHWPTAKHTRITTGSVKDE
jgi:hypothetical protein